MGGGGGGGEGRNHIILERNTASLWIRCGGVEVGRVILEREGQLNDSLCRSK